MNGKEVGKQKLEIAVTPYPLYAALSLLLCSSGGEKILQGVKTSKKYFQRHLMHIIRVFSIHEQWPRHPPSPCIINQEGWSEYFYKQTHTLTL